MKKQTKYSIFDDKNLVNKKGVTLISLIITIIVLVILSGITLSFVIKEEGIIDKTLEAEKQFSIEEEKDMLKLAVLSSKTNKSNPGEFDFFIFKENLERSVGEDNVEIMKDDELIEVGFLTTKRYYQLYKNDEIKGPGNIIVEENAGDITKGGKLDGSKEKPYEINCIEDLVAFSIMTNGRKYQFRIEIK